MYTSKGLQVQVVKLSPDVELPEYATDGSGCFDICAYMVPIKDSTYRVFHNTVFNTGLAFEVPEHHVMLVYSRSGQGFKHDVRLANCVAVIDSDYRGELLIKLTKDHDTPPYFEVKHGDKIAQGMIIPIPKVEFLEVKELSETARGTGGFGSTDNKSTDMFNLCDDEGCPHYGTAHGHDRASVVSFDPYNITDWQQSGVDYIWYSPSNAQYVFSDEASQFDTTPYNTLEEVKAALENYCKQLG